MSQGPGAQICQLFTDISFKLPALPQIWCDNISAIALASNLVFHGRTKHVEIDYHYIQELVLAKLLTVQFVCCQDQLAGIHTKSLPWQGFLQLRSKLSLQPSPFSLRGCEEDNKVHRCVNRFDRTNNPHGGSDMEKSQISSSRNISVMDHGDGSSSSLLNENSRGLIALEGCCTSEAFQLLHSRMCQQCLEKELLYPIYALPYIFVQMISARVLRLGSCNALLQRSICRSTRDLEGWLGFDLVSEP
ncbi:hypothetical protein DVH24_002562 [Malus domestica]|uniref:Reverse transcriptase Ty1/copia-type domain-containing protein n=1 Tax=Malus domestica TaxID=3750 RepID=A0A498K856_MALDO|nr:hypothetical protein DVH24_002562 [Malus domestica]